MELQQEGAEGKHTARRGARRRLSVALVGLLAVLGVSLGGLHQGAQAKDLRDQIEALITPPPPPAPSTTAKPRPKTPVPAYTRVATPGRSVAVYDRPNGSRTGTAGVWYGYHQSMPILRSQSGWHLVRLPERPNGKTGWIKAAHVRVTRTPWRIVLDRSDTRLTVYKDGYPAFTMPAGIGTDKTPTPLGNFYVAVIDHDKSPGYGPFQLVMSAHSEAIQSWKGSGDALIAIHGPISDSSARKIGTKGTKISNGCIRVHYADLDRLAPIPIGSPFDVID